MNDTEVMQPIHRFEVEENLIGSLLIDPGAYHEIAGLVKPQDFWGGNHRAVYEVIGDLVQQGLAVDFVTVENELTRRGIEVDDKGTAYWLIGLLNVVPTSVNAPSYARIVADAASDRRLASVARQINNLAYGNDGNSQEKLSKAQALLLTVAGDLPGDGLSTAHELADMHLDHVDRVQNGHIPPAIATGLVDLDRILDGGLYKPFTYVIGGRPGMGKSALALDMALHAARAGYRVAIFSLEMSKKQVTDRLLAKLSNISLSALKKGEVEAVLKQYHKAVDELGGLSIRVDDRPGIGAGYVITSCQRLQAIGQGPDLVVVDHLHLMQDDRGGQREVQIYGNITEDITNGSKQLGVATVLLAQLNRGVEEQNNKRPKMSDFRESGRIEENAYAMIGLFRDAYYNQELSNKPNEAEAVVIKNRDGEQGTAHLFWHPTTATFKNLVRSAL
jgi:replicative DNA helicase